MKVTVYLSDGGQITVEKFDEASALDLGEALKNAEDFLTFELDGSGTSLVNTAHVVRIDFDQEA